MNILSLFSRKPKPLTKMTRRELRREELMLDKERAQLIRRIERIGKDKQTLFERGAKEKIPELRRALAQEFELKTSEQLMIARQLNVRSKEMMTVSRLRMLRENAERAGAAAGRLGRITENDMLRLTRLIENDAVSTEMYQQRLDDMLAIGASMDTGDNALTGAGKDVLDVWEKMDTGLIADGTEAFEEADRRVRDQQQSLSAED